MTGLLDLPLEIRNVVYDFLLREELEPHFRAVMAVSEVYVKERLPLRNYRGLLQTCRKTYCELKQAIQHLAASKQLEYELDITFSHGRPYFALTWVWFPGLSSTINSLVVNVDLRIREPFYYEGQFQSPHDHELAHLIEDVPESFAEQLFDYIAILLKTLANLLSYGDSRFNLLYTESLVLNFRTPTTMVPGLEVPRAEQRRVNVDADEAEDLLETMQTTLKANAKAFQAFAASQCGLLSPLIQIGSLQFAIEGVVWGEGHNLILAHNDFQWLQY
ncbi:hypothetical protein PMIN06_010574 [Paraphaeosphaeria minitans]|uniref:F-box domain-containing protein n=1 Tax=Paraphaeosphaeria minitans TaxID=565426 RepID=A0A9P6GU71_9PLEO|nr:hypothetical protein PMIN01_01020 [Paraphaeosphaeria minitans]